MAELVYLCERERGVERHSQKNFEKIAERILPENAPCEVNIIRNSDIAICLINRPDSLPVRNASVCLGRMIPPTDDWYKLGAPVPDGSYGIVRGNEETIELVTDVTASRTLYYQQFNDCFIASTSQRAIAHFADSFVPDKSAIAWMVSSGTLGPNQAWDARVEHVGPDSLVRLDRSTWEITQTSGSESSLFNIQKKRRNEYQNDLEFSIESTFNNLNIDPSRWALALSGGMDSRGLIAALQNESGLQTITWGTTDALEDVNSDAVLARELAKEYGFSHEYFPLPQVPKSSREIFERFVTAGEGRIDHISGYLDGFRTFEKLASDGTIGVIRGNNAFGWSSVSSPTEVRHLVGGKVLSDYTTISSLPIPGAEEQCWPSKFDQSKGESLAMWRDRLKVKYRLAKIQSALTSLKTPYIEEINPFLTREIVETVYSFPDELRTEKQLYTDYVMDRSPDIPVAKRSANPHGEQFLVTPKSRKFLKDELNTSHSRSVLGDDLVDYSIIEISDTATSTPEDSRQILNQIKRRVGSRLPQPVVHLIEKYTPIKGSELTISGPRLAFRLYIIQSMHGRLESDCQEL